jgi:hypothetical protein
MENNIKTDLNELGWAVWIRFMWLRIGHFEHGSKYSGYIKGWNSSLAEISQLPASQKDSVSWSYLAL